MRISAPASWRFPGIRPVVELRAPDTLPVSPDVEASARAAGERLRSDPADTDAIFVLAATRLASGRLTDAKSLLDRLIRVRVDYPGVWQLKRKVHEALNEPVAARACARAADIYDGDADT